MVITFIYFFLTFLNDGKMKKNDNRQQQGSPAGSSEE